MEKRAFMETHLLVSGYGKKIILHGISLRIEKGEITALIGRNGVGKTTLLETLMGHIIPKSGQYSFDGVDLTGCKPHLIARRGISYVPQGKAIFPHMTIAEHLDIGGWVLKSTKDRLTASEKVYSLFPVLRDRRAQKAGTLSGGERQMLSIGRSMMSLPRVLLLDEPSFGLSPKMVENVYRRILEIKNEGVTIFLVEQNARKALTSSDKSYVMDMGRVVLKGNSRELLENQNVKLSYLGAAGKGN